MFGRTLSLSARTRTASPEPTLTNRRRRHFIASSLTDLWRAEVDSRLSYFQMNAYYFMAGYMNTISFSAVFVWCGFQSGNTTQLAVAVAKLWEQGARQFLLADKQALASLFSFVGGALIARLVGERIGPTSRGWLWLGTMCQALFTMAAAITSWKSNQGYPGISDDRYVAGPAWSDAVSFLCLMFMSCSMGMQGLMSLRLQTPSAATLPLTTTWCELMGVGALFNLTRMDYARDQKVLGIFSVMLGAIAGRSSIFKLGSPGALGIATGIRVLIAFSWIFVPGSELSMVVMDEEKADIERPLPESGRSSIVIIPRNSTGV
ncbi:hypothetical protein DFS33DRAFT_92773 [Desarmillaria ectypa]|nr:hypothetical protein DFS33DRAFT_92773 [Desarmillaria ectypa]